MTTTPSESELEAAALTRSEEDLNKLAASYDIVSIALERRLMWRSLFSC